MGARHGNPENMAEQCRRIRYRAGGNEHGKRRNWPTPAISVGVNPMPAEVGFNLGSPRMAVKPCLVVAA